MLKNNTMYIGLATLALLNIYLLIIDKNTPPNTTPKDSVLEEMAARISNIENDLAGINDSITYLQKNAESYQTLASGENVAPNISEKTPGHSQPPPNESDIEKAHQQWIDEEFPKVFETSQQNTQKIISVLDIETDIPEQKLALIEPFFTESAIKIANVFAFNDNIHNVDEINRRIQEVNNWKEHEIKNILTKEEYGEYQKINWIRSIKALNQ